MEKGNWELALNVSYNEPLIDCSNKIIELYSINKIYFIIF